MSGRNCEKSSFPLNYVIFLYVVLLSSNCNAYPSLLTGIEGENKEKTSVTDALQNIIMRQLTLISECMSQKNSDVRNDILINKKNLAQTKTELMIMKEENKQLKEQLSKIKIELSDYKAATDQTLGRQETIIKDINSYTNKFKEMYQNNTQELFERLDQQDDLNDAQNKREKQQDKVIDRLGSIISEVKESHYSLKENNKNETQKLAVQLKEQDDLIVTQNKRQLEQDKVIQTLTNVVSELKENDQNITQSLITRSKEQDEMHQSHTITLSNIQGRLKELENYKTKLDDVIFIQNKSILRQNKDIKKLEDLFEELNGTHSIEPEIVIHLEDQEVHIVSQNKTLMRIHAKVDYLENTQLGTCNDILSGIACRTFSCRSGVYSIYVNGKTTPVWCDMETDGGGWTVIQRRQNGNVDFYRTWKEYKIGFGNASDEYWIGNDALHVLTSSRKIKLRVDLEHFNGTKGHATFSSFAVANETNKYRLSLSGYIGDKRINDCFSRNNGQQFTTYDKDNDVDGTRNCAVDRHGGWWYWHCTYSNLNGRYYTSATRNWNSVSCYDWTGNSPTSLKTTMMMIR